MKHLISPDSIGDSLSAISFNYTAADSRTYYLNLSATQLFDPFEVFINSKFDMFTSLITTTKNNSAKWVDLTTDISTNSAAWVKPLVYVHPIVLLDSTPITTNLRTVSTAFVSHYPVMYPLPETTYPSYVENQKAYLYFYTSESITRLNYSQTQVSDPMAFCECPVSYTVYVSCQDSAGGTLNCDNGSFSCSGCAKSCSNSASVACYYENGSNTMSRYISVTVNAYFNDTYEKNLKCVAYQVKNCKWEFVGYL